MTEQHTADGLKARLRADLTAAMKAKDAVTVGTLRMALAAITNAEVAGKAAAELSDEQVLAVLAKEVKTRHESAAVYVDAGREELADKENAEAVVLQQYLPTQLSDEELAAIVDAQIAAMTASSGEPPTVRQLGQLIKAVKAQAGSQAEGSRIAAAAKAAL